MSNLKALCEYRNDICRESFYFSNRDKKGDKYEQQ